MNQRKFEEKLDAICAMPEALALRQHIQFAVDRYLDFLKANGLNCWLEVAKSTAGDREPGTNAVERRHEWAREVKH